MNRGFFNNFAVMGFFALVHCTQAEPPRTLISVTNPLEQLRGNLKQTRELSTLAQTQARRALQITAPKLSERLENLAEVVKGLENETRKLAESVVRKDKPNMDKAENILNRQEKLNQQVGQVKQMLRRDANAQDMKQEEGRERARDADDAVAMMEKPPQDSKNALEESVVNKTAKEQSASLNMASSHQNELAEVLDQLAEHYENLENGEGEKTRSGLREKEEELGIKQRLDEQYAALKEVLELANMSPADQIKALEDKLKDNPVMQDELGNIAENTLDNAKAELDNIAQQAQKGQSSQQQAGNNQQPASDQDVKAAMEAAQQLAEQEVPKIQEDAQQAKAAAATEELKKAKKSLEEAVQKGAQAMKNPAMKPEEKMQAMGEELADAAKALEQAAEKAGEKAQSANDPREKVASKKAQAAAKAAAQKAQQMAQQAQKGQSSQQQAGNNQQPASDQDSIEAYVWAYVAREQARKTPGQKANAVRANIHLNRIKKELNGAEIKGAETKAKEILSKL